MILSQVRMISRCLASCTALAKTLSEQIQSDNLTKNGLTPVIKSLTFRVSPLLFKEINGDIQLKDVYFSYPNRKDEIAVKGLGFHVEKNTSVAVVGPSGSGKSTVLQLILRLYECDAGQVDIDKINIQSFNPAHLHNAVVPVSQEPVLFNGSVYDNISYGMDPAFVTPDQVFAAAKSANIHHFINSLPEGYNTSVGSLGAKCSGGQKQRIAIARALFRQPKVLLLDEATAALDSGSEALVQATLDKAHHKCTCVMVAHRLSTIEHCDHIIVLNDGKIIEQVVNSKLLVIVNCYPWLSHQVPISCRQSYYMSDASATLLHTFQTCLTQNLIRKGFATAPSIFGAMADKIQFPIIDCQNDIASAATDILEAMQSVGFVYLKNFGISIEEVQEVFDVSTHFWNLPLEVKKNYLKSIGPKDNFIDTFASTGYLPPGAEINDKSQSNQVRESYDIGLFDHTKQIFPSVHVAPDFERVSTSFFHRCHGLGLEILRAICSVVGVGDKDFLTGIHSFDENHKNLSGLRLFHYLAIHRESSDQSLHRCVEHTDFGTITILFQDTVGGLEIMDQSGSFVPTATLPGAVLVIASDLLQIWTNDKIKAVKHRVVPMFDGHNWISERRSVAFFLSPLVDLTVQPIVSGDDVPHYSPTTFGKWFSNKLAAGLNYSALK